MNDSLDPILQQEEQRKLRVQLIWRLAIAVILVAGVLATLTWLDRDRQPTPKMTMRAPQTASAIQSVASIPAAEEPISTEPLPVASSPEAEIPPLAASSPAEQIPIVAISEAPIPSTSPAPVTTQPTRTPLNRPEANTPPTTRKSSPIQQETFRLAPSPSAAPAAPAVQSPPAPQRNNSPYPAAVAAAHGYTVQTGVFLHSANAEKMLKQVQQAGIPAYLETRVQIGPFRNRTDADAAVRKLRLLGIEPIIKTD